MVIPDGAVPPYVRHDLDHANPADRPTNAAYDRFVFLAARYRDSGYDDRQLLDQVPFLVAGPLFNAIYLWSTHALAEIAEVIGTDPAPHREAAQQIHEALLTELWDPDTKRFSSLDVVRNERGAENTIVSFAPLLDPDLPKAQLDALVADLASASFHPDKPDAYVAPSYDLLADGLRRAAVLARPRLDQHELAAVVGAAAARPGGGRRGGPAEQRPARRALGLPRVLRPVHGRGLRDRRLRLDRRADARRHRAPGCRRAGPDRRAPRGRGPGADADRAAADGDEDRLTTPSGRTGRGCPGLPGRAGRARRSLRADTAVSGVGSCGRSLTQRCCARSRPRRRLGDGASRRHSAPVDPARPGYH